MTPTGSSPSISVQFVSRLAPRTCAPRPRTRSRTSSRPRSRPLSPSAEAPAPRGGSSARELGEAELAEALQIVETTSPREVARRFGVDRARAEILPAGVILLAEVQRRLGVALHVCGGGIREGAVLASLDALAA